MNAFRPEDPGLPRIPPDRAREYRDRGWWLPERVDRLALRHVDDDPGKEAVQGPGGRLTRRELADAVDGAAARLAALGIARGDRVLVQLPNDLELVVLPLALMRLGAHPVMAVPTLRRRELLSVVAATRPTAVAVPRRWQRFDHLALARELRESCPSIRHILVADRTSDAGPDDTEDLVEMCRPDPGAGPLPDLGPPLADEPAVFLLSSGTTGPPKAIARAHEGYGYMIRTAAGWAGLSADTVYLAVMSAAHGFVLNCPGMLGVLAFGGRIVLGSPGDPAAALDLVDREGVTHTTLVPALVTQWLDEVRRRGHGPTSLRVMQAGGARLEPSPAAEAQKLLGCTVQQCYGMSEGLLTYTALDDPDDVIAQTQGRPASPGDEIRVVDEDGKEVAPGEVGELLTRGPYTVAGYYAAPEADARAFTGDGFYRTGDLARVHPSGGLVVEGRIGDVINRGGEKISAGEVESLLGEHPLLRAVAAVAMPHTVWGQTVCVFAVPLDPEKQPTLLGLRRFLTERGIATFKLPEELRIVDALPMIGVGKINRVALRAAAQERERTP
ncbi:AMP-binding protein [Streptomyces acidiscabies]|uniref:AMP-binding protein n=1 Tax=Streptomyces acidiscabies TaxID=42234 RepID=UPI00073EAAB1|nr:AMP-binding protein [Streptomyces acidiscabies]GAQ50856.1 2,3-dihydroxybenzoate-AMP ligase [Streptomyces acidiscabies]GAV41759.1 2,3-dihydroxybenzoate-AMP ligase [Streptomyces acidiscabies]